MLPFHIPLSRGWPGLSGTGEVVIFWTEVILIGIFFHGSITHLQDECAAFEQLFLWKIPMFQPFAIQCGGADVAVFPRGVICDDHKIFTAVILITEMDGDFLKARAS